MSAWTPVMRVRALIVLLLAMNVGVAAWWGLRPAPGPEPPPALPDGVPRLQLVAEADPGVLQAAARAAMATAAAARPPGVAEAGEAASEGDLHCFSLGPWDDAAAASAAMAVLRPQALQLRERPAAAGDGWRVIVPPLASREAAQAMVARLEEAGFSDHFIMQEGVDANAVALGRFSAGPTARRHEQALRDAGFGAVAEQLGPGGGTWIDLAAGAGFDPAAVRDATGAATVLAVDCARLQ